MATWFITGAARGLGYEMALHALDAGANVVAAARGLSQVEEAFAVAPDFSERLLPVALDVTHESQAAAAVEAAIARFGSIDVLVNNAGRGLLGAVEEASAAEVEAVFTTNVFGLLNVTRAVLPQMRAAHSGHVVNISSMGGFAQVAGWGIYGATKFAVEGLSEAMQAELSPLGIKVTIVEPGAFRTDWATRSMKESDTPISDYADVAARKDLIKQFADHLPGDPRKVAEAVLMVTELDDPPLRLLLGRDVLKAMRDKIAATTASIDEWESVTKDVNFPSG